MLARFSKLWGEAHRAGRKRGARRREKGIAVLLTAVTMLLTIPIVGLAFDASVLYAVKARLSAATDAAALAGGRSLHVGLSLGEQTANAEDRARAFFRANYPSGYLMTTDQSLEVSVQETAYRTRTVTVTASVNVPGYFMRFLGVNTSLVRAMGKASRRDVNVMLVIDRSGSLETAGACDDLQAAAMTFVNQFAAGRDQLGLLTFGGTYKVDFAPATDFKTRGGSNIVTMLNQLVCTGATNSAQAYHAAYKALVNLNEPGALNVILFFTDGQPNTLTFTLPVRTPARGYNGAASPPGSFTSTSRSACSSTADKTGVILWSSPTYTTNSGIRKRDAPAIPVPLNFESSSPYLITDNSGCAFSSNQLDMQKDIAWMPPQSLMPDGTLVSVTGYKTPLVTFTDPQGNTRLSVADPDTLVNASINALHNASLIARNDATNNVVTYSIGLGGVGAAEDELLRRVANDPTSPDYNSSRPEGLYIYAPTALDLNMAFQRIASEILRIAK